MAGRGDAVGLLGSAHVHPDDGGPQRPELLVHEHDGAARAVGAQPDDVVPVHAPLRQGAAHRGHQGVPPFVRLLLGPARPRVVERIGLRGKHDRPAVQREDADAHALGAEVDAHHVGT